MRSGFKCVVFFLYCLLVTSSSYGTARMLPDGVWQFSVESNHFEYAKVGVQNGEDFEYVSAENFNMQHIDALVNAKALLVANQLIADEDVDLETQLVNYFKSDDVYFSVFYGFSDRFMAGITVPYISRELSYTDDYITEFSELEAFENVIKAISGEELHIPPSKAKGNGVGDGLLTLKYLVKDNAALELSYQGGLLQWGKDSRSVATTRRDGYEELATGEIQEKYGIRLYYDPVILNRPVQLVFAHIYTSPGFAGGLDNGQSIDRGDESSLKVKFPFQVTKKLSITPYVMYQYFAKDKVHQNNQWESVDNSETSALLGRIQVSYWPKRYLNFWAAYKTVFHNQIAEYDYDFPGRLYIDDFMQFGIRFYFK